MNGIKRVYGKYGKIKGIKCLPEKLRSNLKNSDTNEKTRYKLADVSAGNEFEFCIDEDDLCYEISILVNDGNYVQQGNKNYGNIIDAICTMLGVDELKNSIGYNERFVKIAHASFYDFVNYLCIDDTNDFTVSLNAANDSIMNYIEFPVDNNVTASLYFSEKDLYELSKITITVGSINGNVFEYNQTASFIRKMKFIDALNKVL